MPVLNEYEVNYSEGNELLSSSYKVYKNAFILPPKKDVTHMYHVLADLLEPGILNSDKVENLTDKTLIYLMDVNSYYNSKKSKNN